MRRFEYFAPTSLAEAIDLLESHQDKGAIPLAAGTDILVEMRLGKGQAGALVTLNRIPGLKGIDFDRRDGLRIGVLVTFSELMNTEVVRQRFTPLAEAAGAVGATQVRNRGTIGGNICHASPAAEMGAPLLALGAKVRIVGPGGERVILLEEFFVGPQKTVLRPGEILTQILVPVPEEGMGGAYLKLSPRKALDLAIVGVAVVVGRDGGVCAGCRIGLGAVAPTPVRARQAEKAAKEARLERDSLEEIGRLAAAEAKPISDIRASAEYRRDMVGVMVKRAMGQAMVRAQ